MEEKKASKKKKGNAKKIVGGILGVGLIVGVTIVGTLAFLNDTTEQKRNTFTASGDIVLELDEPSYNDTSDPNAPDPTDYQPETLYAKDPTLYNLTGTDEPSEEWVAMRVDYGMLSGDSMTSVTREQLTHKCSKNTCGENFDSCQGFNGKGGVLEEFITTSTLGDGWFQLSSEQIALLTDDTNDNASGINYEIYIYKYKLTDAENVKTLDAAQDKDTGLAIATSSDIGGKTTPLFSSVTVQTKEQLITNRHTDTDGLLAAPKFDIIVRGGAAKNDGTVTTNFNEIDEGDLAVADDKITSGTDSYNIVKDLVNLLSVKTPTFSS